jgi:hypothetical protein
MVTLKLRALAQWGRRTDLATVTNKNRSAPPRATLRMSSQALSPSQVRLRQSYRNLTLWTLQGWLSMFFLAAGWAKATESSATLAELMSWTAGAPVEMVQGLGIAEMILAVLLLAPLASWKRGRPLMITAAAGLLTLATVMLGVHALALELVPALTNLALVAVTAPVLWMRAREVR